MTADQADDSMSAFLFLFIKAVQGCLSPMTFVCSYLFSLLSRLTPNIGVMGSTGFDSPIVIIGYAADHPPGPFQACFVVPEKCIDKKVFLVT
jgi:hypothetical protein